MIHLRIAKQSSNHEGQSIDKYLHEIGKENLLTAEEEIELTIRIRKDDRSALEKLVKSNLRFVVSVAKQYQNQGLSLGDLINEGNLGLIKAAKKFDETRGFKFISYAVWWIRQSILQAISEQSRIVRLPLNRIGTLSKVSKVYNTLEREFEREPTSAELAQELKIDINELTEMLKISGKPVSVDAPIFSGENSCLLDVIENNQIPAPDNNLMTDGLKKEITKALSTLSEREAEVVKLYFGLNKEHPLTLDEIGEKFHLTRERVRQIKEKAIQRLRHTSRSRNLKLFLG